MAAWFGCVSGVMMDFQNDPVGLLQCDAEQYRCRAEELRIVAHDMRDDYCRQTTCRLANDYDGMADDAEARANHQQ